jgi:flagellar motility protein MotE (MotC chaperone)
MFKELITRREELDKRQRILQQREALLRAAEQELERKYEELTQLKSEIGSLLEEQSAAELARIKSLVKTYEGMKAKDAARIFNTLSMDVLIEVMSQMSERKTAPIIAAMETERARQVTVLLAEQKKLPSLPVQ